VEADSKDRFSNRAAYYAKFRPSYPEAIPNFMKQELGLSATSVIGDVGSGTGILSQMFLKHGNSVFGVEPNKKMREIAETNLAGYSRFRSINGSAEATTLPASSIDIITAAQSFQWFDAEKARVEFLRILKPGGWVILIWNTRRNSTPFMEAYERLVRDHAKFQQVRHENLDEGVLRGFLGDYTVRVFDNVQILNLEGLTGRLLSSSYTPLSDDPGYPQMLDELRSLFNSYNKNGLVQLQYDTEVYCGRLV
jgi:SAM-dependent methyltransferase